MTTRIEAAANEFVEAICELDTEAEVIAQIAELLARLRAEACSDGVEPDFIARIKAATDAFGKAGPTQDHP